MITLFHRLALDVFGRMPRRLRRGVVRVVAPSYTVGSVCVIQSDDNQVVLIRQRYRDRWGLPGGLLARQEQASEAAQREVREEIGIAVELLGEPAVFVDPQVRRVDVIYRARLTGDAGSNLRPVSVEISAVAWFPLDALPEVQEETATALAAVGLLPAPDG